MNATILAAEIVTAVHQSPDSPTNLAELVEGMLSREQFADTKTLRDEFAMAAASGLLACPLVRNVTDTLDDAPAAIAIEAYQYADAMLAERNK